MDDLIYQQEGTFRVYRGEKMVAVWDRTSAMLERVKDPELLALYQHAVRHGLAELLGYAPEDGYVIDLDVNHSLLFETIMKKNGLVLSLYNGHSTKSAIVDLV